MVFRFAHRPLFFQFIFEAGSQNYINFQDMSQSQKNITLTGKTMAPPSHKESEVLKQKTADTKGLPAFSSLIFLSKRL